MTQSNEERQKAEPCPTCGSLCVVAGETTLHYEPVWNAIRDQRDKLIVENARLERELALEKSARATFEELEAHYRPRAQKAEAERDELRKHALEMVLMWRAFRELLEREYDDTGITRRQQFFETGSAAGWLDTELVKGGAHV